MAFQVLNVHTPSSSFAIVHSITQDSLDSLFSTLTRKVSAEYNGEIVGSGWLEYEFNDTIWNLDDDSDYSIFAWRQQQTSQDQNDTSTITSTIHLHNPVQSLPSPPSYLNPAYYVFKPSRAHVPRSAGSSPQPHSTKSRKTKGSKKSAKSHVEADDGVPKFKKDFEKFHAENGVRTVIGSVGPVPNVRMLLKYGYRHVYLSRKFAIKHGFIPSDAGLGHYGYGGLVNIGTWPITLTPSSSSHTPFDDELIKDKRPKKPKPTYVQVYLSEEPHFDVVLGRSFFEKRQIHTSTIDPTDVVCLDTGEKIECELVILKDGRGQIVTVT